MSYPDKDRVIAVLLEAAACAATDSGAEHPQDIASAMSVAIEAGGYTIIEAGRQGLIA